MLPDRTYEITRRCSQRQYLLKPSCDLNQFFLYCLAYSAERFEILVHAVCVLSNHYHLVVTDLAARLPAFMEWLNGTLARGLNANLGRWENFWDNRKYGRVELLDPGVMVDKIAYALANPVAAGLVPEGDKWTGVRLGPMADVPLTMNVPRPSVFFRKDGAMPESVTLRIVPPLPVVAVEGKRAGEAIRDAVLAKEAAIRKSMAAAGRSFPDPGHARETSTADAPVTHEPRRGIIPQVASRDKDLRRSRLRWIAGFLRAYKEACLEYLRGVRDVVFPAGTYWRRIHLGCAVADLAPG